VVSSKDTTKGEGEREARAVTVGGKVGIEWHTL
jgi:hypothetical protein